MKERLLSPLHNVFPGIPHVESPLFHTIVDHLGLDEEERRVAVELHERGYSVIDFPDEQIEERIERIKKHLSPWFGINFADPSAPKNTGENQRIQDAWLVDEDVRKIASNARILVLLRKLYGRRAFPFQTLNFPVGTQQHLHSDSNHFSSIPERFMCGVWLAMEDVQIDAGPLTYLPGSHKWPIVTNIMIGRRGAGDDSKSAQTPYHAAWNAMAESSGLRQEVFLARKGQALIWAANLLHGGSPQHDPARTRWSQVSHYYFDDCIYYTPAYSDEALGQLHLRSVTNIANGNLELNQFLGESLAPPTPRRTLLRRVRDVFERQRLDVPADFNPETYYLLNPDVAHSGADAKLHYARHGNREGRRYKIPPIVRPVS